MKRCAKRNKYGASTVFMSIILSALIIVECAFLSLVLHTDRRMEITRALKCEAEAILADYDRDLFGVYGVYAFDPSGVDASVFNSVLSVNGDTDIPALECGGIEYLDSESLDKAIGSYYAYRGSGMFLKGVLIQLSGLIESIDKTGILSKIREYNSSGASGYLSQILDGAVNIESLLGGQFGDSDTSKVGELIKYIDDSKDDVTSYDGGIELTDLRFLTDSIGTLESSLDSLGDFLGGALDHAFVAHYAAYNFDCAVDNDVDSSIIGTKFADIHANDYYDAEYIMTGSSGKGGSIAVSALIFTVLFCKNMIDIFSDPVQRAKYMLCAVIISVVIELLSVGTVSIPSNVMEAVIISIVSICRAAKGVNEVKTGGRVSLFEVEDVELVKLGYRDFMYLFMFCVPDSSMLPRMVSVLKRDYGELAVGINLVTEYGGTEYDITKRYAMYD